MARALSEIAAQIKSKGLPLSSYVSQQFDNGYRSTVWGDRLTPHDYAALQALLDPNPKPELSPGQWRALAAADASATARRRRR